MHLDINIRHTMDTANGKRLMEMSLQISKGEIVAVTGPSGAGKTTLLRQIAGLAKPEAGRITSGEQVWLDTSSGYQLSTQLRNTGFVFQDYALFPHLSVRQNLLFALDKGQDKKSAEELLKAIDLDQLADRKPHQLSGGQQQRVALARALIRQPELLLLDEPMAALDHEIRKRMQDYLLLLHQQRGFTMLIVTHDLGEIFRMASRVVILDEGKITKSGSPAGVYLPEQMATDDFILYAQVLSCSVEGEHLLVRALVQQSVRELKLPLHWLPKMTAGRSFTLHYAKDIPRVEMID